MSGLLPEHLGPTPRPQTPELQHIVSRAVTPETLAANRLASYSGPALPCLDTLASLTDQAPPSSPLSNALGLFFGPRTLLPPLSPLPAHDPRLGPLSSNFDPEDLTLCNEWDLPGASYIKSDNDDTPTVSNVRSSRIVMSSLTDQTPIELPGHPDSALPSPPCSQASPSAHTFGAPSPPYIVRSPSPDPTSLRVGTSPPHPHTASPRRPASTPSPVEAAPHPNQENRPPVPQYPVTANPLPRALCPQDPHQPHPHQFFLVRHSDLEHWRPVGDTQAPRLDSFDSQDELLAAPPDFPTVVPFKGQNNHITHITPADLFQASLFHIPLLTICFYAGYAPPTLDIPLGYAHYTWRTNLQNIFWRAPPSALSCFTGSLVLLDIHDFLDGRRIHTYGFLHFDSGRVFIDNQAYHLEDQVRTYPLFLRYTLTPHLPLDPFSYIHATADEAPL